MASEQVATNTDRKLSHVFGDFAIKIGKEVDKMIENPEPTPETKEMIESLTLFKQIESRIDILSDGTIDSIYNAEESIAMNSLKLSETLLSINSNDSNDTDTDNKTTDLFINFTQNVMGRKLFILNTMTTNEYLPKMQKELINPINIYKHKEIAKTKQLITEYENIKFEYDLAVHKLNKNKNDEIWGIKMKENKNKKRLDQIYLDKKKELDIMRFKVIENIKDLKIREDTNLLNSFKKYMTNLTSWSENQSQIINLKDFMETQYEQNKFENINNAFETTKLLKYKCGIPNILIKLKDVLFKYKRHLIKCVFRLGCDKKTLKSVQRLIEKNGIDKINFEKLDAHIIATLIKIFYRNLPKPIFSHICLDKLVETKTVNDAKMVMNSDIPEPYFSYYLFLLDLVIDVAKYSDVNSMSANSLCIVIAPNLYDLYELNKKDSKRRVVITTALISFMSFCVQSRIQQNNQNDVNS